MRCQVKYALLQAIPLVAVFGVIALAPGNARGGTPAVQAPGGQRVGGAVQPGAGQAHKKEKLTKETFRALPDSAVIEVGGQHITKAELLALAAKAQEQAAAQIRGSAAQADANLKKKRAEFRQRRAAGLTEANAKVWAEVARVRQAEAGAAPAGAHEAIAKEADELHQRYQGASPTEKAQIEQRAGQLLRQLQQAPR